MDVPKKEAETAEVLVGSEGEGGDVNIVDDDVVVVVGTDSVNVDDVLTSSVFFTVSMILLIDINGSNDDHNSTIVKRLTIGRKIGKNNKKNLTKDVPKESAMN